MIETINELKLIKLVSGRWAIKYPDGTRSPSYSTRFTAQEFLDIYLKSLRHQ